MGTSKKQYLASSLQPSTFTQHDPIQGNSFKLLESTNDNTENITTNNGYDTMEKPTSYRNQSQWTFYETYLRFLTKTKSSRGNSNYMIVWESPNTTLIEIKNMFNIFWKMKKVRNTLVKRYCLTTVNDII